MICIRKYTNIVPCSPKNVNKLPYFFLITAIFLACIFFVKFKRNFVKNT